MDIATLERNLLQAQERHKKAAQALAPKHKGGEWEEYDLAEAALLKAERELAEAKCEEYAVPAGFPVAWDIGAPMPTVIADGHKTFLIFYVRRHDPNWDGTYITVQDPANIDADPMALVEFEGRVSIRFGDPNDEVFEGHPLYGKGFDAYTAQIVRNSKWLMELESISKVHRMYKPESWRDAKHFVFWFHDDTFECVADGYKVEVYNETLADILNRVYQRMR